MRSAQDAADDLDALKAALVDRLEELAEAVLGPPNAGTRNRAEWRWGTKGSRKLDVRGARRGSYSNFEAAVHGGPLDLIMDGHACGIREAIRYGREFLGLDAATPHTAAMRATAREARERRQAASQAAEAADRAQRIRHARRIAAEATPLHPDDAGWTYLVRGRGIPAEAIERAASAGVLRFHHARRAVVLPSTDDAGEIRAVQLVHVTPEGAKRPKADGPCKLTFGDKDGAAVRLPAVGTPPRC